MCQLLLCPPHSPHTRPIDGAESTRHRRVADGRKCRCTRRFGHADDGCRCAASACDELCIHPPALTMSVARCTAGAQDGAQYITDDVSRGRGHGRRPSVLTRALLPYCPTACVEERVSLNHNCMAVRPLGRRMVAPRAPPGPCVLLGRMRAVGCVWMRVHAVPSGRVWAVPTPSRSRDGLRPSPREQL